MRKLVTGLGLVVGLTLQGQVQLLPDTVQSASARFTYYFSEGLRCKMLGNPDEAISFFQKCAEIIPEKPDPYYELGTLFAVKDDYNAAVGYARNAWKRDQKNKFYGQLLVECLVRQGKPAECVTVYRELQKNFPENEEYLTGEIEVLIQAKLFKEALARLKKIERIQDLRRWSIVRQRDIYEALNKPKKGILLVKKWIDKNPDDFELRGVLAEIYGAEGLTDKALEQYAILKKNNPENPAISFSLGQFYFNQGRKEEALKEYITGFRSPDVNPVIKIEIVRQFIENQKDQEKLDHSVIKLIEVLYETDKGLPGVDVLYANFLYSEERFAEAEPIYTRLTQTDPGDFMAWQNLLFILNQKEDFDRVYQVSDQAITVFPSQGLFYLFKGMAAIMKKEYAVAVSVLNKGLTYPGLNPEITKQFNLSLSEALYKTGDTAQAFRTFDLIIGLEPDNTLALNNYAYYLALENQQLDKALEMISKCVGSEKDNTTYLDTYAWVLFKRMEFGKALEAIKKVVGLDENPSGEVLEHYGDILYKNGMTEEAKLQWIKAKEKGETTPGIDKKIEKGLMK